MFWDLGQPKTFVSRKKDSVSRKKHQSFLYLPQSMLYPKKSGTHHIAPHSFGGVGFRSADRLRVRTFWIQDRHPDVAGQLTAALTLPS